MRAGARCLGQLRDGRGLGRRRATSSSSTRATRRKETRRRNILSSDDAAPRGWRVRDAREVQSARDAPKRSRTTSSRFRARFLLRAVTRSRARDDLPRRSRAPRRAGGDRWLRETPFPTRGLRRGRSARATGRATACEAARTSSRKSLAVRGVRADGTSALARRDVPPPGDVASLRVGRGKRASENIRTRVDGNFHPSLGFNI